MVWAPARASWRRGVPAGLSLPDGRPASSVRLVPDERSPGPARALGHPDAARRAGFGGGGGRAPSARARPVIQDLAGVPDVCALTLWGDIVVGGRRWGGFPPMGPTLMLLA